MQTVRRSSVNRIVLVHGAAHGAWCWEVIVPLLERRGYEVNAFDLPGAGAAAAEQKKLTLQSYIDRVIQIIDSGPTPVLLVGHSMGGAPISGAAEAIPGKVARLVYVAAVMLRDGEAMTGIELAPDSGGMRIFRPSDDAGAYEAERSLGSEVFYNCCAPEVAARASARLGLPAIGPLGDAISLTEERWGRVPKTYIVCARDRALPMAKQLWFCDRAAEIDKHVMDTDHSPFFSDPFRLAEILSAEASR